MLEPEQGIFPCKNQQGFTVTQNFSKWFRECMKSATE